MNDNSNKKKLNTKSKIMLGIIAILLIVIIALIAVIAKKDDKADSKETSVTEATSTNATDKNKDTQASLTDSEISTEGTTETNSSNTTEIASSGDVEATTENASTDEVTTETITTENSTDNTGNTTTENTTTENTQSTTETQHNDTTESANQNNNQNTASSKGSVNASISNQWESEGNYCGQLDITVINSSSSEIKNWSVNIPVANGVSVDSNWNCNQEIKSGKLVIKGVDFNSTVAGNSKIEGIGLIIKAKNKADLDALAKNAVLFIGNEQQSGSTSNGGNANSGNNNQTTTEATTEEVVESNVQTESGTPYANHGKLKVSGTNLVDKNGKKYQLKGVSTHGIAWFPDYVNSSAFKTIRDDWKGNLIRIAMYSAENMGYCTGGDKAQLKKLVTNGVDAATSLGMYVIIDWHVLGDQNPLTNKEEAKKFFDEMSKKYKNNGNVLYEICNEPNGGTSWADVKKYAEEVIPIIKKNCPDAVIIVGTPTWSQDVDQAAANPITGYTNIMYAAHFYAATHTDWLRNKISSAIDSGLPIFISEFSICDASGNGANDYNQAEEWFSLIKKYNLSYASWSLCNKAETSALISSSCSKTGGWSESDLSETGKWIRKKIRGN